MSVGVVSRLIVRSCCHDLSPAMGGLASVKSISSSLCHSTTLRTAVSAFSLWVTPVCNFTLPICVLYPRVFFV